jgi:ABC-type multidrug transport system permease subunit
LALAEPLASVLSILVPLNFLVLFVLFALSGGRVPVAVVQSGGGSMSPAVTRALNDALTFEPRSAATPAAAGRLIARQDTVATLVLPPHLAESARAGMPAEVHVTLDNLNTDFADDVRRALPLAVLSLYRQVRAQAIPLTWREYDTYPLTTGFLGYIAVSLLTVAILIGGLLMGGRGMAGDWERGTIKELLLAPIAGWAVVAGKVMAGLASGLVSALVVLGVLLLIGVRPDTWARMPQVLGVLVLTLLVFLCLGVAAGSLLRSQNAVTPLAFGLGLPLFFVSGAFGPIAWGTPVSADIARAFPVVYANAAFQHAFHGYWPVLGGPGLVWGVLAMWAATAIAASALAWRRATATH